MVVYLTNNDIIGGVNLRDLPCSMEWLTVRANKMTGEVNLPDLPQTFTHLQLAHNKFSGTLDMTVLPPQMSCVDVEANNFTRLLFGLLPLTMDSILFTDNRELEGVIDVAQWGRLRYRSVAGTRIRLWAPTPPY